MGKYKLQSPVYNEQKLVKRGLKVIGGIFGVGVVTGVAGTLLGDLVWSKGAERVRARRQKKAEAAGYADWDEFKAAKKREKKAAA